MTALTIRMLMKFTSYWTFTLKLTIFKKILTSTSLLTQTFEYDFDNVIDISIDI